MELERVTYERDAIVEILRDLTTLVVSRLPRPHPRRHGGGDAGRATADAGRVGRAAGSVAADRGEFVVSWYAANLLAQAREVLGQPFSRGPGPDGRDELARETADVPAWTPTQPAPPPSWIWRWPSRDDER